MHFYELHEGDGEQFFDVLLSRDEEMDPEEFFTVVQSIRRRVQDSFETETLVEAIAEELEQSYGFIYVSDDRLTAAVNVSKVEQDNFLADLDGDDDGRTADDEAEGGDDEDVEDVEDVIGDADYRGVYAEFRPDGGERN